MRLHLAQIAAGGFALAFGLALAGWASAQPPGAHPTGGKASMGAPPAGIARVTGTVSAASSDSVTIHGSDGQDTLVALRPGWVLVRARRVDLDAIQPGAFVASANVTEPSGAGRAVELRIFEPGATVGQGNRPMRDVGQMMTNGTVAKVTKGADGRELDVAYPGGVRHIVVPPDVGVIEYVPAPAGELEPGVAVTALASRGDDGTLKALRISLDPPPQAKAN